MIFFLVTEECEFSQNCTCSTRPVQPCCGVVSAPCLQVAMPMPWHSADACNTCLYGELCFALFHLQRTNSASFNHFKPAGKFLVKVPVTSLKKNNSHNARKIKPVKVQRHRLLTVSNRLGARSQKSRGKAVSLAQCEYYCCIFTNHSFTNSSVCKTNWCPSHKFYSQQNWPQWPTGVLSSNCAALYRDLFA